MSNTVQKLEPAAHAIALTPMDMLERAVSSGASVETLDKLMALQERWEKNQAAKEFNAAIASAKAEIKPIGRNRQGHNAKRYADMAAVANAVDPILSKHGLGYRYRSTQAERITVTCVLFHRSGHQEETTLSGPADTSGSKNAIQAIGSTLTYLERYSLMLALGLAAGDDDDGGASGGGGGGPISQEQADKIQKLISDTNTAIDGLHPGRPRAGERRGAKRDRGLGSEPPLGQCERGRSPAPDHDPHLARGNAAAHAVRPVRGVAVGADDAVGELAVPVHLPGAA